MPHPVLHHNIGYVTTANTLHWDLRTRLHRGTSVFRGHSFQIAAIDSMYFGRSNVSLALSGPSGADCHYNNKHCDSPPAHLTCFLSNTVTHHQHC